MRKKKRRGRRRVSRATGARAPDRPPGPDETRARASRPDQAPGSARPRRDTAARPPRRLPRPTPRPDAGVRRGAAAAAGPDAATRARAARATGRGRRSDGRTDGPPDRPTAARALSPRPQAARDEHPFTPATGAFRQTLLLSHSPRRYLARTRGRAADGTAPERGAAPALRASARRPAAGRPYTGPPACSLGAAGEAEGRAGRGAPSEVASGKRRETPVRRGTARPRARAGTERAAPPPPPPPPPLLGRLPPFYGLRAALSHRLDTGPADQARAGASSYPAPVAPAADGEPPAAEIGLRPRSVLWALGERRGGVKEGASSPRLGESPERCG